MKISHKKAITGTAMFFGLFFLVSAILVFLYEVFGSWTTLSIILIWIGLIYLTAYYSSEESAKSESQVESDKR